MSLFVNLHAHNEFSTFDGLGSGKQMAEYLAKINQKACALTNHGNVSGLIDFYFSCKEVGVKPILGCEFYFTPNLKKDIGPFKRYHLILLARNLKGYKNLMRLTSVSNEYGFHYKPRLNWKMLEKYNDGLFCSSACMLGIIPAFLKENLVDEAKEINDRFRNIFGKSYALEVQPHNLGDQRRTNANIINFAKKEKMPVIVTLDSHYVKKEDFIAQDIMVKMKTEGNKEYAGYPDGYLATEKEVLEMWKSYHGDLGDIKKYIKNTSKVADICNVELEFGNLTPTFDGNDNTLFFKNTSIKALKAEGKWDDKYKARFKKEFKVIKDRGFIDYFLICHDLMNFCKEKGIATGYGRGSVGGSLIAYSLGITKVDPLIHGTLFERFLRPGKVTTPDIDMDFDKLRRQEVFDYIFDKYPNRCAHIGAYSRWQIRNTLIDLFKYYSYEDKSRDSVVSEMERLLAGEKEVNIDKLLRSPIINNLNAQTPDFLKVFKGLFGNINHFTMHPCGVAIMNKPIRNYAGIMRSRNAFITSYDAEDLEKVNILKLDILSLETLAVISIAEEMANVRFKDEYLKDKKVIKRFADLDTDGIFQFEKDGAKKVLKDIKPTQFSHIVDATSINRPVPLKAGVSKIYDKAKNENKIDKDSIWYKLVPETYGRVIYQEQLMTICREYAHMNWADVDKVMKFSEDPKMLKKLSSSFIDGAMKHHKISKGEARNMFNKITLYLFNKAHATAYTIISFYEMWLLTYYPLEFIFALISRNTDGYKRRLYFRIAAKNGIVLCLPHVNGTPQDSIQEDETGEKYIQLGLNSIKGVGNKSAEIICNGGPYENEFVIEDRIPKRAYTSAVQAVLKEQGALEFDEKILEKRNSQFNSILKVEDGR